MRFRHLFSFAVALLVGRCASAAEPPAGPSAESIEFFEKKIRPVLAETCYSCHSADATKLKGKLRLDTAADLAKGGENGSAVVAGNPDESLLIKAIRWSSDDLQMPPKKKLSAEVIADFERWVKMGAPYPGPVATAPPPGAGLAKSHWSFQRPEPQVMPAVKNVAWAKTDVDRFILAALEAKSLAPNAMADKRTLIRRATFDLHGLPPTYEEVEAFEKDGSPNAFEKVIDRLLASPRYGERWGRYWLDLARYADTKGYVFQEERRYPYSYTYRDWVVQALNEDMPYDQFVVRQIAADLLPKDQGSAGNSPHLAALGFLTLGRRFLNNQPDIIDDRMDVVFRSTQALTVACARCHDHKYDPIPIKDYYSLYGVFASATEPKDLPLLPDAKRTALTEDFERQLAAANKEVEDFIARRHKELAAKFQSAAGLASILQAVRESSGNDGDQRGIAQKYNLPTTLVTRWREHLRSKMADDPVWGAWVAVSTAKPEEFAAKINGLKTLDAKVAEVLVKASPGSVESLAKAYASAVAPMKELLEASPSNFPLADTESMFIRDDRDKLRQMRNKPQTLQATHAGAPARAMALQDGNPHNPRVFVRGNANNPGDAVPRQFLACLSPGGQTPFKDGSGRLELAQLIASKDNPLTARVMVNRIWLGHFGNGLVRTPSDFGTRGELPTHPALLDHLAIQFMNGGWSIKAMHKRIMLSAVYRQTSLQNPHNAEVDPENRLLWRMNIRRLDFEATRDSLLAVSEQLDPTIGGRPVDIGNAGAKRRSIYGFIDRQNLPGMFRSFDFASPDAHTPQRFSTTVPQQALFMLNNAFVVNQARSLVQRPEAKDAPDAMTRARTLYRMALSRNPTGREMSLALAFIEREESSAAPVKPAIALNPTWQYGYGGFDESSKRTSFTPLPHFTGSAWQGSKKLPDDQTSWCLLTADGGHAGDGPSRAVIRRFNAPHDGTLRLRGKLSHGSQNGDGVRARVVSSRAGILGTYTARFSQADTKIDAIPVKAGDTIDFVVDAQANVNSDSFTWPIKLKWTTAAEDRVEYDSAAEFSGSTRPPAAAQPLTAWEKYAHVLLLANEFVFVD